MAGVAFAQTHVAAKEAFEQVCPTNEDTIPPPTQTQTTPKCMHETMGFSNVYLKTTMQPSGDEHLRQERKSFANSTDAFSLAKPPPVLDQDGNERVRKKSARAKLGETRRAETQNGFNKLIGGITTRVQDTWRRVTESQCDPYVRVELRPGMYIYMLVVSCLVNQ